MIESSNAENRINSNGNAENRIAVGRNSRPLSVRLPRSLHEQLRRVAETEGESEATIVRNALRRALAGRRVVESR